MALNEDQASIFAQKLLLNMAESGSLQAPGPNSGTRASLDNSRGKGRYDAIYLATLYRELVSELQK